MHRVSHLGDAVQTPRFAVIIPSFARTDDPLFVMEKLKSWTSVLSQTYTHWILIAVADGMNITEFKQFRDVANNFYPQRSKLVFLNLDPELREVNVYKGSKISALTGCSIWCVAGVNAINLGISFALSVNSWAGRLFFSHIARLDYDDFWMPSHLRNLADAYAAYPNALFAYSRATGYDTSEGFPLRDSLPLSSGNVSSKFYLIPPLACRLIHSTVAWSLSNNFSNTICFRSKEQLEQPRYLDGTKFGNCVDKVQWVYSADADLWQRIMVAVNYGLYQSIFIDIVDVSYTGDEQKKILKLGILEAYNSSDVLQIGTQLSHAEHVSRDWNNIFHHIDYLYAKFGADLKIARSRAYTFCVNSKVPQGWPHAHHCLYGTAESEIIYLRIRELRPENVLELSSACGYSTLWILMALEDNKHGTLHSLDVYNTSWPLGLPDSARFRWKFHLGDAKKTVLELDSINFEYLMIDTAHEKDFTKWYMDSVVTRWSSRGRRVFVNFHDVYEYTDDPAPEGIIILQWLAYSQSARNVFTFNQKLNPTFFSELHNIRVKHLGNEEANRVIGGRHDLAVTIFADIDIASAGGCVNCTPH